jgi:hypothetical protein|uniref:Uncharacterized protein n=1 Tax=Cyanidiaceae sp. MX-AZ01 TaxID=1503164 RepID=A0A060A9B3_9RHOD|nr:hypothetical protein [Cyanidiaceae sp. MX-AZ01]AIA61273.1 hypothetical protein [Cyanidiaceae sp. MX-AZ01]
MVIEIETYAAKKVLEEQVQQWKRNKNWKQVVKEWQRSGNWARVIVKQPWRDGMKLELTDNKRFAEVAFDVFDGDELFIDQKLLKALFFGNWCDWMQAWKKIWCWYTSRGFEPASISIGDDLQVKWKETTLKETPLMDKPLQTYLNFYPNRMVSMKALTYKIRYLKQLYKTDTNGFVNCAIGKGFGVEIGSKGYKLHASGEEFGWEKQRRWSYVTTESAASSWIRMVNRLGKYEYWFQWREQACASMGLMHTIAWKESGGWSYHMNVAFDVRQRLLWQWPICQWVISPNEVILMHGLNRMEYHHEQFCLFVSKNQMGVMWPWKFHLAINGKNQIGSGWSL